MDNNIINKRTKGEWTINKQIFSLEIVMDSEFPLAVIPLKYRPEEVNIANAKFIVKAVNNYDSLLEALKYCENILSEISTQNCWKGEKENLVNKAQLKAKAAIQKAEQ